MINILIPSAVIYENKHIPIVCRASVQMLTFEHYTCYGLEELYTLAGLSQHVGSRNNVDHELLYSPYKYTHINIKVVFMIEATYVDSNL